MNYKHGVLTHVLSLKKNGQNGNPVNALKQKSIQENNYLFLIYVY